MHDQIKFNLRLATLNDLDELNRLMVASIRKFRPERLTEEQIEASLELAGLDSDLFLDDNFYVAENDERILGCGGWSQRGTILGMDHRHGLSVAMLNPKKNGARIRAMYTHPEHGQLGIAKGILAVSEAAAIKAGYRDLNALSTASSEPFYLRCGYSVMERLMVNTHSGLKLPLTRVSKHIYSK